MERLNLMPEDYLKRFCRRGTGSYQGMLLIDPELRGRVRFVRHNLLEKWPESDDFDVIFLRNVLIYFDQPTRQRVLDHLCSVLRPGGWLIIGHCESLAGLSLPLQQQSPSVYRRVSEPNSERMSA